MSARQKQRVFLLRLAAKPGTDPTHALRWLLKLLWRRFGLRCVELREERP